MLRKKTKNLVALVLTLVCIATSSLSSFACFNEGKVITKYEWEVETGVNWEPDSFWSDCWYLNNETTQKIVNLLDSGSNAAAVAEVISTAFGNAGAASVSSLAGFFLSMGAASVENANNGQGIAVHYYAKVPVRIYSQYAIYK